MNSSFIRRLVRTRSNAAGILAGTLAALLASHSASAADPAWAAFTGDGPLTGRLRENIAPTSACQGDAVLQRQGHSETLMRAVQAARYAMETVPDALATGPVGVVYAGNPAHVLRCWFRADGLELQSAGTTQAQWQLKLRLCGYGRETLQSAAVDGVSARQNRVELSRADGAVVEWYENKAAGLEQGFTVRSVPPGGTGALRLLLEADGDLRPELEQAATTLLSPQIGESGDRNVAPPTGARAAKFLTADGQTALRYSGLKVWDATQRELPAHLEVQGRQLTLVVDDRDATYPVTIDPLITSQEAKLTAGDGATNDNFGYSVSVSGDGNMALVGAGRDTVGANAFQGSAYVFVRNGSTWSQQAKLTAADGATGDQFGSSVSLSGDGNTALIGAFADDTPAGADAGSAYVFVRSGSTWTQQMKLTAADGAAVDLFGDSVSVSGNGNYALVGARYDDTPAGVNAGSAYVFVRSGITWSQQAKLTATDAATADYLGVSVSLSWDGNTALVGASLDDTAAGAEAGSAYVFVRSGTAWSQQAQLTAADGAASDNFGWSVSVCADGNTALVGAMNDDTTAGMDAGSAYVFVRSGTAWNQQAKLTAGDGVASDRFGWAVSVSGDGNMALVGAYWDDTAAGADAGSADVFARSGTTWNQQAQLTAADGAAGDQFGSSVSLSGDGNTALVGAYADDTTAGTDAGSAYVFRLVRTLVWNGNVNSYWDLNTTANWSADGLPASYHDGAIPAFDDSATGTTTVNLTTALAPGGVTVTNSTKNYTFTGPGKLTGPTGLTKNGTGVLTVLTDNDYTGGTIIDGGTLQLGDGGTSGSVTSNLIDNGTLIFNRSDAVTFAGTISGTGTLTKTGTGTLTLTGNNTCAGATSVTAGTLEVAAGGSINPTAGLVTATGGVFRTAGTTTVGGTTTVDPGTTLEVQPGGLLRTGAWKNPGKDIVRFGGRAEVITDLSIGGPGVVDSFFDVFGEVTVGGTTLADPGSTLTVQTGGVFTTTNLNNRGTGIGLGIANITQDLTVGGPGVVDSFFDIFTEVTVGGTTNVYPGARLTVQPGGRLTTNRWINPGIDIVLAGGTAIIMQDLTIPSGGDFRTAGTTTVGSTTTVDPGATLEVQSGGLLRTGAWKNPGKDIVRFGGRAEVITDLTIGGPGVVDSFFDVFGEVTVGGTTLADPGSTLTVQPGGVFTTTNLDNRGIGIGRGVANITQNLTVGGPGVVDSFFDIFTEVTVGGTTNVYPGATLEVQSGGLLRTGATTLAGTYACEVGATEAGTLAVTGNLTLTGATLSIQSTPTASSYTLATYSGTLTGTFNPVTVPGYKVKYGTGTNSQITLVKTAGYQSWADANAPGQTMGQDHDFDGVSNGIEYFMGLSGSGFTANPAIAANGAISWPKGATYTGTYGTDYFVETSLDLSIWAPVPEANVAIDADSVDYVLHQTDPAKFARLKVTGP
ncbi:MAG: autotransporter-associated beta strand repeat-containing protein [Verrucomicrobia bacterium]|nr:autotransporter-associated beta strand repeat-containing protein [Verrucomicrobiota bacterium]